MTCSECPRALTPAQVRRGNKTCGRSHGIARANRIASPKARDQQLTALFAVNQQHARRRILAAILEDLRPHVTPEGFVSLRFAAHTAVKWRRIGYHRGYASRWHHERYKRDGRRVAS